MLLTVNFFKNKLPSQMSTLFDFELDEIDLNAGN